MDKAQNKSADQTPDKAPSSLQKPLAFCAVLVVCALIYLFVTLQETDARAAQASVPSPSYQAAASPTPARPGNLTDTVFFRRLGDAGIFAVPDPAEKDRYAVGPEKDDPVQDTLTVLRSGGSIRGFSLRIAVPADDAAYGGKKTAIEQYLKEQQERQRQNREERVGALLPPFLCALSADGYFPASVSASWVSAANAAYEDGKSFTDKESGISFTALRDTDDALLLIADRV